MKRTDWSQLGPRLAWLALVSVGLVVMVLAVLGFTASRALDERVAAVAERLRSAPAPGSVEDTAGEPSEGSGSGFDRSRRGRWSGSRSPGDAPSDPDDPAAVAVWRIQQRHLFMPPPPQGFRNAQGVLGDRVLYPGGQSFGLGENAMGATVVALGSNWVELKHEDETIVLDISYGGERGPELMRWDGTPPEPRRDGGQSAWGGNRRGGGMGNFERDRGSRRNFERGNRDWGERGERGGRRQRGDRGNRGDRGGGGSADGTAPPGLPAASANDEQPAEPGDGSGED